MTDRSKVFPLQFFGHYLRYGPRSLTVKFLRISCTSFPPVTLKSGVLTGSPGSPLVEPARARLSEASVFGVSSCSSG